MKAQIGISGEIYWKRSPVPCSWLNCSFQPPHHGPKRKIQLALRSAGSVSSQRRSNAIGWIPKSFVTLVQVTHDTAIFKSLTNKSCDEQSHSHMFFQLVKEEFALDHVLLHPRNYGQSSRTVCGSLQNRPTWTLRRISSSWGWSSKLLSSGSPIKSNIHFVSGNCLCYSWPMPLVQPSVQLCRYLCQMIQPHTCIQNARVADSY